MPQVRINGTAKHTGVTQTVPIIRKWGASRIFTNIVTWFLIVQIDHYCSGFTLLEADDEKIPSAWKQLFQQQTLKLLPAADLSSCYVVCKGLPYIIPEKKIACGLIEQMLWVLAIQPFKTMICPLYVSSGPDLPPTIKKAGQALLHDTLDSGYIALFPPQKWSNHDYSSPGDKEKVLPIIADSPHSGIMTHALLDSVSPYSSARRQWPGVKYLKDQALGQLKNRLTLKQKIWLKNQLIRLKNYSRGNFRSSDEEKIPLARKKSWQPFFLNPRFKLNISPDNQRIPILLATHWLELGGAEKFAVDLIRELPKNLYRIYVTTDIPSFNSWEEKIADDVEEIIHLPSFLPPDKAPLFYNYFLQTRGIRLVHIHHALRFYESLAFIRRFHPGIKILDTLHILELPPHSGGYPEMSGHDQTMFIDIHHVISKLLKKFLKERWLIPENKIVVNYLNVDTDFFNPALVPDRHIRDRYAVAPDTVLVGFIGRFTRQKRPLEFVRMADQLLQRWERGNRTGELRFIMTGSGVMKKEIKKTINRLNLESKLFLQDEMADPRTVYKDCDIIVMTSESEGLALVCYEAMAMETPVFSTDVGAQSELLSPEFLVADEGDIAGSLAAALWPCLLDKNKLDQAGRRCREYILNNHQAESTFKRTFLLYEQMLANASISQEAV